MLQGSLRETLPGNHSFYYFLLFVFSERLYSFGNESLCMRGNGSGLEIRECRESLHKTLFFPEPPFCSEGGPLYSRVILGLNHAGTIICVSTQAEHVERLVEFAREQTFHS